MENEESIKWISVKLKLPSKTDSDITLNTQNGVWVLGWSGGNTLPMSIFYGWESGFFQGTPTHWCYINLPK